MTTDRNIWNPILKKQVRESVKVIKEKKQEEKEEETELNMRNKKIKGGQF